MAAIKCGIIFIESDYMKFELKEPYRIKTKEELITDLKKIAKDNKLETISTIQYRQLGKYSYKAFRKIFGTWDNALNEAGLKPTGYNGNVTKEELISDLKKLYMKIIWK